MSARLQSVRKQFRFAESNNAKQRFLALLLIACVAQIQNTASADDFGTTQVEQTAAIDKGLEETDRALTLELIKLAKFNIHFHLDANRHQVWRQFSYPILREAGTAGSFAATIIDLRQQAIGLDNPARISRRKLKDAVRCSIVGNAISGGASALELAQNSWEMLKATERGYSPARSLAFVKGVVKNTDHLLRVRDELAAQELSPQRRRVTTVETKLIRRIRQQLLFEFATWSCHSRDQAWRENTFYTLDSLQNFTRMSAGIVTMKAFNHPELGRGAVICALVGNSVATVNPIFRDLVGVTVRKHQERKIANEIPCERPEPSAELDVLQEKLSIGPQRYWLQKLVALTFRTEKMDVELNREVKEIERYRRVAQQQSISGPLIGLTGVASSTLATVAVYGYPHEPKTAIRLGFAGRNSQLVGQSYALINTPSTMIYGMIRKHRLRKRGELPSQILAERLRRLENY
jgi:hypothetical protein